MTSAPPPILPATFPPELDRWNWGAFLLNWIWVSATTPSSRC
jgi:hypothetical protein